MTVLTTVVEYMSEVCVVRAVVVVDGVVVVVVIAHVEQHWKR